MPGLSKRGVPPAQKQPGSGYPLQVLGLKTGLRAFRFYPSRGRTAFFA
jgi:hypothetical protein